MWVDDLSDLSGNHWSVELDVNASECKQYCSAVVLPNGTRCWMYRNISNHLALDDQRNNSCELIFMEHEYSETIFVGNGTLTKYVVRSCYVGELVCRIIYIFVFIYGCTPNFRISN